jgi:hypothetical protein
MTSCYPALVTHAPDIPTSRMPLGLCANCIHARRITSDRGSVFLLCELSKTDPQFEKYPRLPVLSCSGYVQAKQHA